MIYLASQSNLKKEACQRFWFWKEIRASISPNTIPQPFTGKNSKKENSGKYCAEKRISEIWGIDKEDILVGIENEIQEVDGEYYDVCIVVLYIKSLRKYIYGESEKIPIDKKYVEQSIQSGFQKTAGYFIHQKFPEIPANDWMGVLSNTSRKDQIFQALYNTYENELKESILRVPNFPKEGVMFQDLSYILANPTLYQMMKLLTKHKIYPLEFNLVVGLDSRGYIYGDMIMNIKNNCGFVMARKKGKCPLPSPSVKYSTEYSQCEMEILSDIIKPNHKILIVDDLVATGGSLKAVKDLVIECGGSVTACFCVLKVDALFKKAEEALGDTPIITLF